MRPCPAESQAKRMKLEFPTAPGAADATPVPLAAAAAAAIAAAPVASVAPAAPATVKMEPLAMNSEASPPTLLSGRSCARPLQNSARTAGAFARLKPCIAPAPLDLSDDDASPSMKPSPWYLLHLPPQLEAITEQFRQLASSYLLCERDFPLAARSVDRLAQLAGIERGSDGLGLQRLLAFASDSFSLHWDSPHDPLKDEVWGLRSSSSRDAGAPQLCLSYKGPRGFRGRMRPSDIVRAELQLRRRLLQHLESSDPAAPGASESSAAKLAGPDLQADEMGGFLIESEL